MGEQKVKKISEEDVLKQAEEQLKNIKKAKQKIEKSSENDDNAEEKIQKSSKKSKVVKVKQQKTRSKKYQETKKLIDKNKKYLISDAIELAKKTSYTKFEGSLEVHIRLKAKKSGKGLKAEIIRGLIELPYPTGKKIKVGVIDEVLAEKILKDKTTDFEVLLAKPEMMPKIARLAKILGPRGLMPNPKSGTVTTDPQQTMKKILAGRCEFKSDKNGIIHFTLGKVLQDNKQLQENFNTLVSKIGKDKLQTVTLCATMGPGVKVDF